MNALGALALGALLALSACDGPAISDDDEAWLSGVEGGSLGGKADRIGPMTVSSTWVPGAGFVRVLLDERFDLVVTPSDGVTVDARLGRRRIVDFGGADGFYEVTATVAGSVAASVRIRVSDTVPTIELTSPVPGSAIEVRPGSVIEVRGRVTDPLGGETRVTLRGRDVEVASDGRFVVEIETAHGVNVVELGSIDGADNFFGAARSFVAAERLGGDPTLVHVRIGDRGIEHLLGAISDRLPETVRIPSYGKIGSSWGTDVYFDGADLPGQPGNLGSMAVTLDTVSDGQFRVTFEARGDIVAHLRVDAPLSAERRTTVTITNLRVSMDLTFEGRGDELRATTSNVELSDEGLDFDVERFPDWIANLARGRVRNTIRGLLERRTGELVTDTLRGVAGDYQVPGSERIASHRLSYRLDRVSPQRDGLSLTMEARLEAIEGPDALFGAPLSGIVHPGAPRTDSLSAGLSYDLLNQWAYLQWSAGRLSYSMTECDLERAIARVPAIAAASPTIDVYVDTHLAPVVGPGTGGALAISAGEVEVSIFLTSAYFHAEVVAMLTIEADLEASVEDGVARFRPTVRSVRVELRQAGLGGLDTETVARLLEEIGPEIANRQASVLRDIPIPGIRLDGAGMVGSELRLVSAVTSADAGGWSITGELVLGERTAWRPEPRPEGTPREACGL